MNTSNPWLRFAVALVGTALAIRIAIDLIAPVFGYLLALLAIVGLIVAIRWWRNSRW